MGFVFVIGNDLMSVLALALRPWYWYCGIGIRIGIEFSVAGLDDNRLQPQEIELKWENLINLSTKQVPAQNPIDIKNNPKLQ